MICLEDLIGFCDLTPDEAGQSGEGVGDKAVRL